MGNRTAKVTKCNYKKNAYAFTGSNGEPKELSTTIGQSHTQMYMMPLRDLTSYPSSPSEASSGCHSISAWFCNSSSMWLDLADLASDDPSIEKLDNSINIAQNPQEQDLQTVPRFTTELNLYSEYKCLSVAGRMTNLKYGEYCKEYSSQMPSITFTYMPIPLKHPSTS